MPTNPRGETGLAAEDPVYAYKASLLGAPFEFRLAADALEWRKGRHEGRTPYDRIHRVRLSFRPATMQSYRFLAEIWPANGPKLQIASTSWRSMMDQERLDAAYTAFLTELNRRIGAAGGTPLLQTGSPPLLYWLGLLIFIGVSLGLAALIVRALQLQTWSAAAFVAAFMALFLWQAGGFFRRNRPGRYRAEAVPSQVLPG
ncbi:MAG: hypothetical protein QOG38_907 [Hyphomicrobiales bacterium]|nr:hypothetical protein [Hyphomicrobiales bacterium]